MKRALALLLVSALSLSLLSGCSAGPAAEQLSAEPISLTAQELAAHGPDVQDACDALSSFGLELLQNTEQSGESTLLSPLSVILALSMAANGAEGETLAQFQEALGGACGWIRRGRSLRSSSAAAWGSTAPRSFRGSCPPPLSWIT